jgi:hypothetical protein
MAVVVGSFDELSVDERRAGAHERELWGSRTWHTLLTSGDRRSGMIAVASLRPSPP